MSLSSHDKSIKYLLAEEPADFLRFGLSSPALRVVRPIEADLPARDRQVDGGYLVERNGQTEAVHVEFWRRHQSIGEVALDLGEAQIRIRRRENVAVSSLLYDLYGTRRGKPVEAQTYWVGAENEGTSVIFMRINLRAMTAAELLSTGPRSFLALVLLTADGAAEGPLRQAVAAISARTELSAEQQADHLTVLNFLAEAEDVPLMVLQSIFTKEKLMESNLYKSIYSDGEAHGEARGEAKALLKILITRLGKIAPSVRDIVLTQAQSSPETLSAWLSEAVLAMDEKAARRLVRKISAT